ncbi:glycine/betaine ABC transporter substrate-binding protein [Streptomyces lydicus]|uniref:Glycine/betaine ABC transporter substrate-binding protein n=1 Tax=Streptomyces lydicus TaxID=47763 RepID=A0A3S9YAT6_9ACTN|nr:glycine betaine ABC transporter substrate-binding protein [Streptomyces lydicus]AZS72081.1 glycine/betaine ABC transporter substrate-binding protein [Streptomyces lydicus]
MSRHQHPAGHRRRFGHGRAARLAVALLAAVTLGGCGLVSGSVMTDNVRPGPKAGYPSRPLSGAQLTVTSKEFTEQIILGQMMGIVFEAAGAKVIDRTSIQGSIGAREAVKSGTADAAYEYTGTGWITYLGHTKPIVDPHEQWKAVRDEDAKNGIVWLPASKLNNTYALALNSANLKKLGVRDLSDVAALSHKNPGAVTMCVENEFATRNDGLPGMARAYGMQVPSANVRKMTGGVVYTETQKGTCALGEVFTTDGRIKAMHLHVLADDKHFFPNYNVAPEINAKALKKYPVLAPVTKALNNTVAQELNRKVDVDGEDPHEVAKNWLIQEGFIKEA